MPLRAWRSAFCQLGFTLAEMLIVVFMVGLLAVAAVPSLNTLAAPQADLLAGEVASVLRLAMSEARRTGQYVLVDGRSAPGSLRLYISNAYADIPPASGTAAVLDPLTRQAVNLTPSSNALFGNSTLEARFMASGAWGQLLIYPGATQLRAFDGAGSDRGALEAGSGIRLTGAAGVKLVAIQEVTGLVSLP